MKFNLNLNIVAAVTVTLLGAAVYYKYTTPVEEIKTDTDKTKIEELVRGEAVINNVNSIASSIKTFFTNGEGM